MLAEYTNHHRCHEPHQRRMFDYIICPSTVYDRIRESIMIWPVQDHNDGTHFYTVRPYKPRTRQNFLANCRKTSTLVSPLLRTLRKAVVACADVLRQFAARRHEK